MTGYNKQLIKLLDNVFEGRKVVMKHNVTGDIADFIDEQNKGRIFQRRTKFYKYSRIANLMRINGWKNDGDRWIRGG